MTSASTDIIKQRIDTGNFVPAQALVVLICFILNMLDGFDIVVMSVVVPVLSDEWAISKQQIGIVLSAALLGMTLGAMFLAPLCDKYGRRRMLLFAALGTGICMIVTAQIQQSFMMLVVVRMLTGLGIGVIMASTTSITTEFVPEKWRNLCVPLVVLGYPFGAMAVGPVAELLAPFYGWQSLFYFGGIFTLMLAVFMLFFLSESISFLASQQGQDKKRLQHINKILIHLKRAPIDALPRVDSQIKPASVSALLHPKYRRHSIKLWVISFSSLLNLYFLFSWLPSLFVNSGLSLSDGRAVLTSFSTGGVFGIILIGLLSSKVYLLTPIRWFYGISAVAMFTYAWLESTDLAVLNTIVFLIGLFFQGAYTGMYTVASRSYPSAIRATGVGWAIGLGRTGAIVAPVLVGQLVALNWNMYELFALFALPIVLVTILSTTLKLSEH